jgi:hypothetical protein
MMKTERGEREREGEVEWNEKGLLLSSMHFNLTHPILNIVESSAVGHVISQYDTHGASIIGCGDGLESLLACRVPYLQFHFLIPDLNRLNLRKENKKKKKKKK